MTNLRRSDIQFADSPSIDAFGRLRVSEPIVLLDSKRVGTSPDLYMTDSVSGSGVVSYQQNRASTYLTVGSAAGSAIRQTKSRAIYQPAKSLLLFQTFIMAPGQSNLIQRVGYFDTKNGIFLELNGATLNFVRRSFVTGSVVDVPVPQASWNLDKFNGTGVSGITLDITKPQILFADFEWLGVGRVRIGFVINGIPHYCHEFLNTNTTLTSVYMSNPNLPMRWEITATSSITGTAILEQICGSVSSEGGYDISGVTLSYDMGTVAKAIATNSTSEILAIRMRSSFVEFATAYIQQISAYAKTSSDFMYRLVLNPTETVAGTWSSINNSVMESNIGRTVTAGTGAVMFSGYTSTKTDSIISQIRPVLTLGTTLSGITDVISLQVLNLGVASESYSGSITWREIY
jgi:hypothetical protein